MLSSGSDSEEPEEDEEDEEEEEFKVSSGKDCPSARQQALDERRNNPSSKSYIPQCTPLGTYQEVQCYNSFCWCVDTLKGLPMKGSAAGKTSTTLQSSGNNSVTGEFPGKPDCSQKKPAVVKKSRECETQQKYDFLRILLNTFEQELIRDPKVRLPKNTRLTPTGQEFIIKKKFRKMDINSNKVLDVMEWKNFKRSLRNDLNSSQSSSSNSLKKLRHCFKLFFHGCDTNRDNKVTQDEWYSCTGLYMDLDSLFDSDSSDTRGPASSRSPGSYSSSSSHHSFQSNRDPRVTQSSSLSSFGSSSSGKRRRGPNPFQTILKAD